MSTPNLSTVNDFLSENLIIDPNTRFSKYLAHNIGDFTNFSYENLAIDLAAYLMELCQKNNPDVFGFYQYHYEHFCNMFVYKSENLFRHYLRADSDNFLKGLEVDTNKVPFIIRRERESIDLDVIFDKSQRGEKAFSTCILGNAFYEFRYKNFVGQNLQAVIRSKEGAIVEHHGKEFTLIEEYYVKYSRNRRDKTIIFFKPNRDLLFNNFKYFLFADLNKFKELSLNKKKLFIYISSKINELKLHSLNEIKISVNEGCKICNINLSEAKQNKKKLKAFLNEINLFLEEENRFTIIEEKLTPNSKFNYLLSLRFNDLKPYKKEDIIKINLGRYSDYFQKSLYDSYVKYHYTIDSPTTTEIKLNFEDWIKDNSLDLQHKITAYIESQAVIYNNKLDRDSYQVLKEFTPEIEISPENVKQKLLKDPLLKKVAKLYSLKITNDVKGITDDQLNKDKFLNHSIEMFLKAYPSYEELAYAEDKDSFFIVYKSFKKEIS